MTSINAFLRVQRKTICIQLGVVFLVEFSFIEKVIKKAFKKFLKAFLY